MSRASEHHADRVARRTERLSHASIARGRRRKPVDPDTLAQEQAEYRRRFG